MPDLTAAELARRYGVARSTMVRALDRAARDPQPGERPPRPVNPGEPQPRYPSADADAWWPHRKTTPGPSRTGRAARPPARPGRGCGGRGVKNVFASA